MVKEPPVAVEAKSGLNRVVGLTTGILLVAGIMIGSGAFKKIAPMAQALNHESYILLAWIVAGIITMFGAFTYAGLATMTTETGGVYEYLRIIFGDFTAFLFGWSVFTIIGSGAIAALAFVFAQSVNTLIPLPDPLFAMKDLSLGSLLHPFADSGIKILAITAILLLTWLNSRGIRKGSILNNIVTSAKLLGILLLIVAGLWYASGTAATNGPITAGPIEGAFPLGGLFGAMLSALWAYDGWANITYMTGEIKNPKRNVPLAIMGGVALAMTLYVLLNYTYMKVLPLSSLAAIGPNKIAAAEIGGIVMGRAGSIIIASLIMICTFGALNGCIISYPRVYYRMAQENAFFKKAAAIHPRHKTPYIALVISAIWSCVLVISGTFDQLTDLIILTSYLFFGFAAWGLIKMKRKGLITSRVIGYPVIPIVIILFCAGLIVNTVLNQWIASAWTLGVMLVGIPFYSYFRKKGA